jgi:hypothetical protein
MRRRFWAVAVTAAWMPGFPGYLPGGEELRAFTRAYAEKAMLGAASL